MNMRGIVLHCKHKDCQKLLAKDVILNLGSQIKLKCSHCGRMNCICSTSKGITIEINDEENNRAVFLDY